MPLDHQRLDGETQGQSEPPRLRAHHREERRECGTDLRPQRRRAGQLHVRRLAGVLGVVLVVQAQDKDADIAIQAKEHLEEAGAKILGAVLNRRRYVIPEIVYRRL